MADDEPLGLAPMLPNIITSELSPSGGSVNVLDMISQDVLLGHNYHGTMGGASTEVTYVSQYAAPSATPFYSAAPFTSAGDVFLPSMSVTTASNTFVKPLHTYVPPSGQNTRAILKPSPRPAHRPTNVRPDNPNQLGSANPRPLYQSSPNPIAVNPIVPNLVPIARKPISFTEPTDSKSEKSRKSSKKSSSSSSKKSKSRSHGSHKRSSRSKSSKKSSHSRSKGESILSIGHTPQSAFVPTSARSLVRSPAVTHTATRAANTVTESAVTKATETVTYSAETLTHSLGLRPVVTTLRTATVTSYTATKTQIPTTGNKTQCSYDSFVSSGYSTTSTITSYTGTRSRMPTSITSPMQSSYLPASFQSGPTIISRSQPAPTGSRPASTTYVIPVSSSTDADDMPRLRARFMIPKTNTSTTTTGSIVTNAATVTAKHRVTRQYGRTTRSQHVLTNVQTYASSTTTATATVAVASRTITQSTFALPPGATLYTAKKISTARATRSRTTSTPEPQTYTFLDGKGSFATLTVSSDFTTTSDSSLIVAHTQSTTAAGSAGIGLRTSPITTDTVIVTQNQYLIPIANSQMSPSTSLGYLVTSPIGSDIIATRNSAVVSPQNTTTTTTAIGSHTITTISPETFNRIRTRLFCNVPSTGAALGSLSPSTVTADKTRGPVTIISNHLLSAGNQRDGSGTLSTAASNTATPTRKLYAFTAPVTTLSSSATAETGARAINPTRMVLMSNMHVSSNNQSTASSQGTYMLRTGVSSSDVMTTSSRIISPLQAQSTVTAAVVSMTATTTSTRFSSRDVSESASLSSIDSSEMHSKLRSRLTIPITSTEASIPTYVTTHTYNRSQPSSSVYAVPDAPIALTSSTKTSCATTRGPGTMTFIRLTPSTSANVPTTISAHRLRASPALPTATTLSTTLGTMTNATPTLTNTGHRFVIKLESTPSVTTVGSVTTAVTTPITTAVVSPHEHQFLEPQPMPTRLRTFPGPRTYPVAHRLATANTQRPLARSVNPRPKKAISNPAPLQIFADVVNPRTTAQSHTPTTAIQGLSRSRHSTVILPQYKTAVFKNLSTVGHPNPERASSRLLTTRTSSDRIVLNRSLSLMSPRRSAPGGQTVAQNTPTAGMTTQRMPRLVRAAHLDTRSQVARNTSAAPESTSTSTSSNPRLSPNELDDIKE